MREDVDQHGGSGAMRRRVRAELCAAYPLSQDTLVEVKVNLGTALSIPTATSDEPFSAADGAMYGEKITTPNKEWLPRTGLPAGW